MQGHILQKRYCPLAPDWSLESWKVKRRQPRQPGRFLSVAGFDSGMVLSIGEQEGAGWMLARGIAECLKKKGLWDVEKTGSCPVG